MQFKKLKNLLAFVILILIITTSSNVFAYSNLPTMDNNWGFSSGSSVKTRYWQYGGMDWCTYISYANNQIADNYAKISLNLSNNNSYDTTKIKLSSNYWYDQSWIGVAGKASQYSFGSYKVEYNSAVAINSKMSAFQLKSVALHEIIHCFGLNDCEYSGYYGTKW